MQIISEKSIKNKIKGNKFKKLKILSDSDSLESGDSFVGLLVSERQNVQARKG